MAPRRSHLLAFAQLLRLPNVFTALADPLAGWLLTARAASGGELALLATAAATLYTAGIVFNDCFDYAADCRDRPERPLPSGAIARGTAWALAAVLLLTGLVCAALVSGGALMVALVLAALILSYDSFLKRTGFGPVALGVCRGLNLLLGMVRAAAPVVWAPTAMAVYVTALSFIARQEEINPVLRQTVKRLLLGIIVLDALFVAVTGNWLGAAGVLLLLAPAFALSRILAMT